MGTLEALGQVNVPQGMDCELVIVDNASADRTAEVVESTHLPNMSVRYLYEAHPGKSHGINLAHRLARGELLLFTDDDARPNVDWISALCAPLVSGCADVVTGNVCLAPHLERPWMRPIHRVWLSTLDSTSTRAELEPVPDLIGINMAFCRRVLSDVPELDTELGPGALGLGDDTLFGWRLQAANYRIVYTSRAQVTHYLDESRLRRATFVDLAQKRGRSAGYLAHHWEHRVISVPRVRLEWRDLLLKYWRIRRSGECSQQEGMPEWEMHLLWSIYFYKQYLLERTRPPKYNRIASSLCPKLS